MWISGVVKGERRSSIALGAKRINGKKLFAWFRFNCFVFEDLLMWCRYEPTLCESRVVIYPVRICMKFCGVKYHFGMCMINRRLIFGLVHSIFEIRSAYYIREVGKAFDVA